MTTQDKAMLQRVDQWLESHSREMIDELVAWASHPSVSRADLAAPNAPFGPDCRKMLDFALERGRYHGFESEDYQGYAGCVLSRGGEGEIGMVCHLDVVPEGDHWTYPPYEPTEKDGWLVGRGVGDNKGPGVLSLFALKCLKDLGYAPKHTFRILYGCAEETGMEDFRHYVEVLKAPVPQVSLVADASFPLCYAQKGGFDGDLAVPCGADIAAIGGGNARNIIPDYAYVVLKNCTLSQVQSALEGAENITVSQDGENVKVEAAGKAGHAAFPDNSLNAIGVLAKAVAGSALADQLDLKGIPFLAAVLEDSFGAGLNAALEDEVSGRLTSNGGIIKEVDGELVLTIDIRFPVTLEGEDIRRRVAETAEKLGGRLQSWNIAAPYYIDPQDPKVKTLMEIYNDITGDDAQPYTMGGGTYSRVVPNAMTFGPGLPKGKPFPDFLPEGHGGAHGPDEALCLEEWFQGFRIYVMALMKLDQLED